MSRIDPSLPAHERAQIIERRRAHDATRAVMRAAGIRRLRLHVPVHEPIGEFMASADPDGTVRLGYVRNVNGVYAAVVEVVATIPEQLRMIPRFTIEDGGYATELEALRALQLRVGPVRSRLEAA